MWLYNPYRLRVPTLGNMWSQGLELAAHLGSRGPRGGFLGWTELRFPRLLALDAC